MTNQLNLAIVATLAIAVTASFAQSWLEPTFYLYTRANRGNNVAPETLKYQSSSSIEASHFNGALPTKVITHGYFDSSSRGKWMEEMAGRMLDAEGSYQIFSYQFGFLRTLLSTFFNILSRRQRHHRRLEQRQSRLLPGGGGQRQAGGRHGRSGD